MNKIILGFFVWIFFSTAIPSKKIKIWLCGDSTIAIKQTSAYPETGWGMPFAYFWDSTAQVVNLAKNGRSTKTFFKFVSYRYLPKFYEYRTSFSFF
jgi:hypothetical protein